MTPYSDPNDKREWQKQNFRKNYGHKLTNQPGDPEFRELEAERKKPWYQKKQKCKRVVELFEQPGSFLPQFGTLRTWLRRCSQDKVPAMGKVPAMKHQGKWYTSIAAVTWSIWQCGDEAFKENYRAPCKPYFLD